MTDKEELTEEIVENIIEIIETESFINDHDEELIFIDDIIDKIRGYYGL